MKTFTLNEIIYPTGGKTVFEFEANKTHTLGQIPNYFTNDVGGLRIRRKLNYTADNKLADIKEYEYSEGKMDIYPTKEYFSYSQLAHIPGPYRMEAFRRTFVSSEPLIDIAPHGSPVVYTNVEEIIKDVNGNKLGGTSFTYDYRPYAYSFPTTNGATSDGFHPIYRPYSDIVRANNDGKLRSVYTYGQNGVSTTVYDYDEVPTDTIRGFYKDRYAMYVPDPCPCGCLSSNLDDHYFAMGKSFWAWHYANTLTVGSHKRLKEEYKVVHPSAGQQQDGLAISTKYFYENGLHDQPTIKIVTNSKGEIFTTTYKYAHDFADQEPYVSMVSRHIWSPVVEEKTAKEGDPVPLQITKTNFGLWNGSNWTLNGSDIIVPKSVETKVQSYDQEERTRFDSYDDRGNITTVSKKNDIKMSYVWGYNKTLPIAEVANASIEQAAYTSFEDNEFGNWSLKSGSVISTNNTITGKKTCGGGVTKTVPTGNYIVTAWASGNCTVNGQAGTQLAISKRNTSWRYLEWKLNNVSSVDVSGDNIDEVRLHPEDAQMTTYTYDPLIGMTSKADINNRIGYYEYDPAGRLLHIRDDGYNILKKYQYAFQDNNENADASRVPNWQYTGVSRDVPCSKDPNFITGVRELEQMDANSGSATYGKKRFVVGGSTALPESDWQFTNNYRCKEFEGQLTGELEREQKNMNPCSYVFGITRWVLVATNSPECPKPVLYKNPLIVQEFYSGLCNTPAEEPVPYPVTIPEGMFTSLISPQDAYDKAIAYGQQQADANGQCQILPIHINFANNSSNGTEKFTIYLHNQNTSDSYMFEDVQFTQSLGPITPGTYTIEIYPYSYTESSPVYYGYYFGCDYYIYGGEINAVYDIPLNYNCNTITVE
jgi:hypothetical protein